MNGSTNGPDKKESTNGHLTSGSKQDESAKLSPGPAASDFRSDVVTRPTPRMMEAMNAATLMDDVFAEDPSTNDLQAFVADLTGKEAGLLVTSGTMGNQLSIRTHLTQPPHSILADASSHIIEWEAGGLASLTGALAIPVRPANKHHLTLADVRKHTVLSSDIHACPTGLISLENTLGGTILPLDECRAIAEWARSLSPPVKLHLDGARLWEAVAAGAGSLVDYAACFDSVSLCFSKGLGAPIGSIIVGDKAFIQRARRLRKPLGGGMRQTGLIAAPASVAVTDTFLAGRLADTHVRARQIAELWQGKGGRLSQPCETNMVWFDLAAVGVSMEQFIEVALQHGVKVLGGRLVVHYQIGSDAVHRLEKVMDVVLQSKGTGEVKEPQAADAIKRERREVMALETE